MIHDAFSFFFSPPLSPSLSWSADLCVCLYLSVLRDNVVYWKTKRKINNDLQYSVFVSFFLSLSLSLSVDLDLI